MRTYGKRSLRGAADKAAGQKVESRDAVLWDILLSERVCRCKVQGSSELVVARFPQNWASVPEWAKPGQAVRIAHRGGVRGYVEVAGFGRAIPTPVSGSATPVPAVPVDAILAGEVQSPSMVSGTLALQTAILSGAVDRLRPADAPWTAREAWAARVAERDALERP